MARREAVAAGVHSSLIEMRSWSSDDDFHQLVEQGTAGHCGDENDGAPPSVAKKQSRCDECHRKCTFKRAAYSRNGFKYPERSVSKPAMDGEIQRAIGVQAGTTLYCEQVQEKERGANASQDEPDA